MLNRILFKYGVYYPTVMLSRCNVPGRLNHLLKTQYRSIDEIESVQNKSLELLTSYARENVPYYRDFPVINSREGLATLPFLEKKTIKKSPAFLHSGQKLPSYRKKTGGSTGEPLVLTKTQYARSFILASMWRGYSWAGINIGDKRAHFWRVPTNEKYALSDWINNRVRVSAFSYGDDDLDRYLKVLLDFNPVFFYGYVSTLADFASFINRKGISSPFSIKSIISTAEILTDQDRNLIENTFDVKVHNEYGCGELGTIAHECEYGSMHINSENLIVEVVDENGIPCSAGKLGELVITELNNYKMPLIRYKIKDYAILLDKKCGCGRGLPIMVPPVGRSRDRIIKEDGTHIHGAHICRLLTEAMESNKRLGLDMYQIIQKDYNAFLVKIVPNTDYGEWTKNIFDDIFSNVLGTCPKIDFETVDLVERSPSGKLSLVIGLNG